MNKQNFFLIVLLFFGVVAFAQNTNTQKKREQVSSEYDRSSISYVLVNFANERYSSEVEGHFKDANVKDYAKFDDHSLGANVLNYSQNRISLNSKKLQKALEQNKFANEAIAIWWSRDANGNFSTELVEKRGRYDASDEEVKKSQALKRGESALFEAGEGLINKTYLVVMDYRDIKTMTEIYDAKDAKERARIEKYNKTAKEKKVFKPVKRNRNGYKGKAKAYLYRIDFNDSIKNIFYENLWVDESTNASERAARQRQFEEFNFPLVYIASTTAEADGSQANAGQGVNLTRQLSKTELLNQLVKSGGRACLKSFQETTEEFKIRTAVFQTAPIQAKIGKKESLKIDDRFFVFENRMKNGQKYAKRKGIIRAKKVSDNMGNATGQTVPSNFYQVYGGKIQKGMAMEEAPRAMLQVYGGYAIGQVGGGMLGLEVLTGGITSSKVYAQIAIQAKEYDSDFIENPPDENKYTFIRFDLGWKKEFWFARNFHIAPIFALSGDMTGWKYATNDDYSNNLLGAFGVVGAEFGLNVSSSMQLVALAQYYQPIGNAYYWISGASEDSDIAAGDWLENSYQEIFLDREGINFTIALKYQF